jgi:hypothetical protein
MKCYSNKYIFMAVGQTDVNLNSVKNLKPAKSTKEAISNLGEGFDGFSWKGSVGAVSTLASGITDLVNAYNTSDLEQFEKQYNKGLTLQNEQLSSGINSFDDLSLKYN